jgi:hypothetical protein
VLVQEPEKIDDCWQRGRFSTLIPRERIVAAAGETRFAGAASDRPPEKWSDLNYVF